VILVVCPNPSVDTLTTVSEFSPGGVHRALSEEHYPGGKGVHVAMAARELGSDVNLLAFWAGPTGEWIRDEVEKRGIVCGGSTVSGWSRSCITLRTSAASNFNETELLGCGPVLTETNTRELTCEFKRRVESSAVVVLSGSWPTGAPDDGYASLIKNAAEAGRRVILDCTGSALEIALKTRPFAVHLNASEANGLLGIDDPAKAAALLVNHCQVAIVTAGKDGAFFCADGQILHAECSIHSKYSAVGSGDCLVAGFAVAMAKQLSLNTAAALACACGAANCLRPELGMLHHHDVEQLLPRVKIRTLS
jgi:tagatose 6-phosphate kinase